MLPAGDYIRLARENKTALYRYAHPGFPGRCPAWLPKLDNVELNALCLLAVETPADLLRLLSAPYETLDHCINQPVYRPFQIPKKKGGFREIFEPEWTLKRIQHTLCYYLQAYYLLVRPEPVHGFVINPYRNQSYCNIAANAALHVGRRYVLNIDLKDFFPGITARAVRRLFASDLFRFPSQIATALTLLSTYEGRLPAGAPSSPALSNFICKELDNALIRFSAEHWLTYSRYADDLTFSSDARLTDDTLLDIINLIHEKGFRVNAKKIHLKTSGRKQTVTGLVVNEKVNIERHLLKKIRAMVHDFRVNGLEAAAHKHYRIKGEMPDYIPLKFAYRLRGYVNFVGQIRGKDDPLFRRMKEDLMMGWECMEGVGNMRKGFVMEDDGGACKKNL